jgi:hypothetical protein
MPDRGSLSASNKNISLMSAQRKSSLSLRTQSDGMEDITYEEFPGAGAEHLGREAYG